MSIRLTSVRIQGFRALQSRFEASFLSPSGVATELIVVAGPNGTGKTSILEAILLALGKEEHIAQTLIAGSSTGHWRMSVPDSAHIEVTFNVSSALGTELGAYAPCDVRVTRGAGIWGMEIIRSEGGQPIAEPIWKNFLHEISVEYFSSWRGAFQLGGVRPSTNLASVPHDEQHRFFRLKQLIINERAAGGFSERGTKDKEWLEQLNKVWQIFHGGVGAGTWIDAGETSDPEHPFDLFLVQDLGFGPERICPLDMASSGELEWVTLVGTLIATEFRGLLVIDEPELHLHPQWQTRFIPALRQLAPDTQVIVATHSAYPWDQALSYQRILLLPDNDPRASIGSSTWEEPSTSPEPSASEK